MSEFDLAQLRHAYEHLAKERYSEAKMVLSSIIRRNEGKSNA